jgi:hypothetical protein
MDIDQHMEVVLRFCGFNPVQELAIQADDLDTFEEVHRVQDFERDSKIPSLAMCHDRASFMRNIKLFPTFILAVENQLSPMMGEMAVGRVHHFVQSLKTGKMSESWLKKQRSKLAKADRLRDTITYKSERTMTFKKFLTKMDSMINGFIDGGEPLSESQKGATPHHEGSASSIGSHYDIDQDPARNGKQRRIRSANKQRRVRVHRECHYCRSEKAVGVHSRTASQQYGSIQAW